ncbi:MAG: hypothetical protein OXB91_01155 [Bryobacterales bacterium]|nr:hypothetical protein [Bryobacterales bacterium]
MFVVAPKILGPIGHQRAVVVEQVNVARPLAKHLVTVIEARNG